MKRRAGEELVEDESESSEVMGPSGSEAEINDGEQIDFTEDEDEDVLCPSYYCM